MERGVHPVRLDCFQNCVFAQNNQGDGRKGLCFSFGLWRAVNGGLPEVQCLRLLAGNVRSVAEVGNGAVLATHFKPRSSAPLLETPVADSSPVTALLPLVSRHCRL